MRLFSLILQKYIIKKKNNETKDRKYIFLCGQPLFEQKLIKHEFKYEFLKF